MKSRGRGTKPRDNKVRINLSSKKKERLVVKNRPPDKVSAAK